MSRVSAVILAAGQALRAGGPKAVWPVEGVPSVRRVAEAALGAAAISEVLAVTGAWEAEVRGALRGLAVRIVPNPDYAAGQSASLAAGAAAVEPEAGGVMFLLADQPFLTSQIIDDLVLFKLGAQLCSGPAEPSEARPGGGARPPATITAPFCRGRRRNPVLFDLPRWRQALMAAEGDRGGRGLLATFPEDLALRPFGDDCERCFLDFDTPADYERVIHASAKDSDNN